MSLWDPGRNSPLGPNRRFLRRRCRIARAGFDIGVGHRWLRYEKRQHVETVTSQDGTTIAYDRVGEGPALVLVCGAFMTREAFQPLAAALSGHFTVVSYNRRGRGESGDTAPYTVERELEDLEAVINAVGGTAFAHGMSSGTALALLAAAAGLPISRLSGVEPPYRLPGAPPIDESYGPVLQELADAGRNGDMIAHFMTKAVGQPQEVVDQMRQSPMWPALEAVAPTLLYDNAVMGDSAVPAALAKISVPVLTIASTGSPEWLRAGAVAAAELIPGARHVPLEGGFHDVPVETLAPQLVEFVTSAR